MAEFKVLKIENPEAPVGQFDWSTLWIQLNGIEARSIVLRDDVLHAVQKFESAKGEGNPALEDLLAVSRSKDDDFELLGLAEKDLQAFIEIRMALLKELIDEIDSLLTAIDSTQKAIDEAGELADSIAREEAPSAAMLDKREQLLALANQQRQQVKEMVAAYELVRELRDQARGNIGRVRELLIRIGDVRTAAYNRLRSADPALREILDKEWAGLNDQKGKAYLLDLLETAMKATVGLVVVVAGVAAVGAIRGK